MISRDRPEGTNAFQGVVKDLGYFGKDSLYRVMLTSGALVSVNSVNTTRGSGSRVAEWDDKVWLSFEPSAAILLKD
jgi:putrescine transport system ATP-binding protein